MLSRLVSLGLVLFLCGCGEKAPPDPRDQSTQFTIPPDIEKAWRKAGAGRIWIKEANPTADSELELPTWTFSDAPEDNPCDYGFECQFVSGFFLNKEAFEQIDGLPEPPGEFCLSLENGVHGNFLPADVARLARFKNLVGLRVIAGRINLDGQGTAFPNVRLIELDAFEAPGALEQVAQFPKLQHLKYGIGGGSPALSAFAGKELKTLEFESLDESVPGTIAAELSALAPQPMFLVATHEIAPTDWQALVQETSLKHLDLSACHVTDAMLLDLAKLPHLKYLYLASDGQTAIYAPAPEAPAFTPEGVRTALAGRKFSTLELPYNTPEDDAWFAVRVELLADDNIGLFVAEQVTDAGLAPIRTLPQLEEVGIQSPHLTDACLEHLASLPKLKYLNIYGPTKITSTAAARLKEQLPELEIEAQEGFADEQEPGEPPIETPSEGTVPATE